MNIFFTALLLNKLSKLIFFILLGGPKIQEDCNKFMQSQKNLDVGKVYTSCAGDLKCQKVIHAVGPRWRGGNRNEDNDLYDTVYNCLEEACRLGLTSIGLPAISAGIFGFPIKESAKITVEAVDTFFIEHNKSKISLKVVYLVNHILKDAQIFVNALQSRFQGKVVITDNILEDNMRPVGTFISKIILLSQKLYFISKIILLFFIIKTLLLSVGLYFISRNILLSVRLYFYL